MRELRTRMIDLWMAHPRAALALRAACAAALAWILVWFIPGAQDYPYYAPFGAVIATTFTLAGSVRESLQAVAAIGVGGTIAWLVDTASGDHIGPVSLAVVVALAVAAAGLPRLGAMGGWVPTAAIFTLILGHGEATFIGVYAGLTLFGAAIGVLVNLVTPPLPLAPARIAVGRTRRVLAAQLRELADLMVEHELPSLEDWHRDHDELTRARAAMAAAVTRAQESLAANARARRHRAELAHVAAEADSLDRVSLLVTDVSDLILRPHGVPGDPTEEAGITDGVRVPIARAMHSVAGALDAYGLGADADPEIGSADAELRELLESDRIDGSARVVVHGIVLALRRALDTFG